MTLEWNEDNLTQDGEFYRRELSALGVNEDNYEIVIMRVNRIVGFLYLATTNSSKCLLKEIQISSELTIDKLKEIAEQDYKEKLQSIEKLKFLEEL